MKPSGCSEPGGHWSHESLMAASRTMSKDPVWDGLVKEQTCKARVGRLYTQEICWRIMKDMIALCSPQLRSSWQLYRSKMNQDDAPHKCWMRKQDHCGSARQKACYPFAERCCNRYFVGSGLMKQLVAPGVWRLSAAVTHHDNFAMYLFADVSQYDVHTYLTLTWKDLRMGSS